jgi:tRNA (cmo5U34)-methyltransferase
VRPRTGGWSEDDSRFFLRYADVIIPHREEQLALVTALVPARPEESFLAVDLACGAGQLTKDILERYPSSRVLALDGSPEMLREAAQRLQPYSGRFELRPFDLARSDWLEALTTRPRCIVSSLAVHHLPGPDKRRLFTQLAERLAPSGALLIQDIVEPSTDRARQLYALAWDAWVKEQSVLLTGSLAVYERFRNGWNHFATPDPDDMPSTLGEQLRWLREAGLEHADCFAAWSGFAVFGAFKPK